MKKKLLPLAMLAGLAGAAGTAQAVHVNPDGLGEALIYPFYTVENGQDTYITVVNTTDEAKAVKVRFIEAMNSREVLDFNLYLSPQDHWSASVTMLENSNAALGPVGSMVAGLAIPPAFDNSCTVPSFKRLSGLGLTQVEFRPYEYLGDGAEQTLIRTTEGYVEIIEMGVLDDLEADAFGAAAAVDHGNTGVPANCALVEAAWLEDNVQGVGVSQGLTGTGEWATVDADNQPLPIPGNPDANMAPSTGGLYGYGVLINTMEGTNATYSAVALDSFIPAVAQSLHTGPGDTLPSLASSIDEAEIIDGDTLYSIGFANGTDAVSSTLMHDTLANDYVLEPGIMASTDWVITFPTKRFYVNADPFVAGPFTDAWEAGQACEPLNLSFWDREEQQTPPATPTGGFDFSPRPTITPPDVEGFNLCREVNIISFQHEDNELADFRYSLYGSERILNGFQTSFNNGWARINFTADTFGNALPERVIVGESVAVDDTAILGLPVTGFAVQKYSNGGVGDGAFYSGLINHKYTRSITVTP